MTINLHFNTTPRSRQVYMDISIGGEAAGRVKFQLNADVAPRTCENFRSLCVGDKADIPLNRARILGGICRGRRG